MLEAEALLPEPLKKVLPVSSPIKSKLVREGNIPEAPSSSSRNLSPSSGFLCGGKPETPQISESSGKRPVARRKQGASPKTHILEKEGLDFETLSGTTKDIILVTPDQFKNSSRENRHPDSDSLAGIFSTKFPDPPPREDQSKLSLPTKKDVRKKAARKSVSLVHVVGERESLEGGRSSMECDSGHRLADNLTLGIAVSSIGKPEGTSLIGGLDLCHFSKTPLDRLSASNHLITRALAMEEKLKEKPLSRQNSEPLFPNFDTEEDVFVKTKTPPDKLETADKRAKHKQAPFLSSDHTSPATVLKFAESEKNNASNGSCVKSEDDGCSVSGCLGPTVNKNGSLSDVSSCGSSPPSPAMDAFHDINTISFKSLADDDRSSSKPTTFRADTNYKFSTFLMLLKDMHDSREKDGSPLILGPGANGPTSALIKEEPSLMSTRSGERAAHGTRIEFFEQNWTPAVRQKDAALSSKSSRVKPKRVRQRSSSKKKSIRDKAEKDLLLTEVEHISSLNPQSKKQSLLLTKRVSGADTHLEVAYGKDLPIGSSDGAADSSEFAELLTDSCGPSNITRVAPKKRWQRFEEGGTELLKSGEYNSSLSEQPLTVVPSEHSRACRDNMGHTPDMSRSSHPKKGVSKQTDTQMSKSISEVNEVSSGKLSIIFLSIQ